MVETHWKNGIDGFIPYKPWGTTTYEIQYAKILTPHKTEKPSTFESCTAWSRDSLPKSIQISQPSGNNQSTKIIQKLKLHYPLKYLLSIASLAPNKFFCSINLELKMASYKVCWGKEITWIMRQWMTWITIIIKGFN